MGKSVKIDYEARFWPENPLPEHVKVWPFKTNHFRGDGLYASFQRIPSGVTLRYVVSGDWTLSMRGHRHKCGPGQIFCAMPSESVEFRQTRPELSWDWYELQFTGPGAESFLSEFGFGPETPVATPSRPHRALRIFKRLHAMIESEGRSASAMLSAVFALLGTFEVSKGRLVQESGSRHGLVKMAKLLLESEHWMGEGVEKLSSRLGVERTTLYRAFKAETGMSPHGYMDSLKLLRAEDLLSGTSLPVASVASQTGFPDVKYFIGWFKARRGVPPGSWRRKVSSADLP